MAEPTSALTFADLIVEVARRAGIAYHGPDGSEVAQIPIDPHDLDECKRHVNNALRMFFADFPLPNGWRFTQPVASFILWPTIAVDTDNLITSTGYSPDTDKTTLVIESDAFYPSMEEHSIVVTGVGTFTIADYLSATTVRVRGNATAAGAGGVTWSIATNGNYTLPKGFEGLRSGAIHYQTTTAIPRAIEWEGESEIRRLRVGDLAQSGTPFKAAIRPMSSDAVRRRWELIVYPTPSEVVTVEFAYDLGFDKLVELDEGLPTPVVHDATVLAACLAVVEKDVEESPGANWAYYRQDRLPYSHKADSRSAPSRLEGMWDRRTPPSRRWPTISVNS